MKGGTRLPKRRGKSPVSGPSSDMSASRQFPGSPVSSDFPGWQSRSSKLEPGSLHCFMLSKVSIISACDLVKKSQWMPSYNIKLRLQSRPRGSEHCICSFKDGSNVVLQTEKVLCAKRRTQRHGSPARSRTLSPANFLLRPLSTWAWKSFARPSSVGRGRGEKARFPAQIPVSLLFAV